MIETIPSAVMHMFIILMIINQTEIVQKSYLGGTFSIYMDIFGQSS